MYVTALPCSYTDDDAQVQTMIGVLVIIILVCLDQRSNIRILKAIIHACWQYRSMCLQECCTC